MNLNEFSAVAPPTFDNFRSSPACDIGLRCRRPAVAPFWRCVTASWCKRALDKILTLIRQSEQHKRWLHRATREQSIVRTIQSLGRFVLWYWGLQYRCSLGANFWMTAGTPVLYHRNLKYYYHSVFGYDLCVAIFV
jgi:hypothetical protein